MSKECFKIPLDVYDEATTCVKRHEPALVMLDQNMMYTIGN